MYISDLMMLASNLAEKAKFLSFTVDILSCLLVVSTQTSLTMLATIFKNCPKCMSLS